MFQFLKKLKLYTKLGPETVHKPPISIHQNLFVIICGLPVPKKVFLHLEYHTELLLHLYDSSNDII